MGKLIKTMTYKQQIEMRKNITTKRLYIITSNKFRFYITFKRDNNFEQFQQISISKVFLDFHKCRDTCERSCTIDSVARFQLSL